jgi:hypothetical protein
MHHITIMPGMTDLGFANSGCRYFCFTNAANASA